VIPITAVVTSRRKSVLEDGCADNRVDDVGADGRTNAAEGAIRERSKIQVDFIVLLLLLLC
jgi:hypothetical protein